jgi:hypothetical protein
LQGQGDAVQFARDELRSLRAGQNPFGADDDVGCH